MRLWECVREGSPAGFGAAADEGRRVRECSRQEKGAGVLASEEAGDLVVGPIEDAGGIPWK